MISQSDSFDQPTAGLRVRSDGPSGTIVIDRVTKRNALTRSMLASMHQALDDLHQEHRVRAVILTGAGDTFCAGSDLLEIKNSMQDDDAQTKWFADCMAQKDLVERMLRFPKPIIAAVNGPAAGLGAALVMASDVAIATERAKFGFPETRRGLVAGIATPLLAFRLGSAATADFLMRGELVGSRECLNMGIYRTIVADDLVWAKADAIARELIGTGSEAVSMTKRLLNETVGEQLFTQLSAGAAATATARTTEAAVEGVTAFLEKRDPQW